MWTKLWPLLNCLWRCWVYRRKGLAPVYPQAFGWGLPLRLLYKPWILIRRRTSQCHLTSYCCLKSCVNFLMSIMLKRFWSIKKMMATWNPLIPPRVFRICLWVEWMENDSEWSTNFTLDVLTYPIASILAKVIAVGMVPKNLTKFKIRIQWMAEKVRLLTSIWDL